MLSITRGEHHGEYSLRGARRTIVRDAELVVALAFSGGTDHEALRVAEMVFAGEPLLASGALQAREVFTRAGCGTMIVAEKEAPADVDLVD